MSEEARDSRREMLKKVGKTAAFVIPTMITFKLQECKVNASETKKSSLRIHAEF